MQKFIFSLLVLSISICVNNKLISQDCGIGALQIEVIECTPNNVFWILLDFEHENTGDEGFRVQGNGNNYGDFEYEDLPVEIGPLEANCEFIHEFVVFDNQFDDCAEDFAFAEPVCCEEEVECFIDDIEIEVVECNPDHNFWVIIDFDYDNVGHEGFSVIGNGTDYGDFEYASLPIEIGPLEAGCDFNHEFVVFDNHHANCGQEYVFEEPACCQEECSIDVVEITVGECDTLGFRQVEFYVVSENTGDEGFDIMFFGISLGHFDYDSGPYTISVPGDRFGHQLLIIDSENEDCYDFFYVETDECEFSTDCNIDYTHTDLEFECTSNNTYIAYVHLDTIPNVDSVWISFYEGDALIPETELISVNDFPYNLGEFEVSNILYFFLVHEQNNPFCYTGNEWNDAPDCSENGECEIYDLIIEAQECTAASGEIYVDLAFKVENPESSGFLVRGNGVIYDTFVYGQVYYTVGPILADCETNYEFIVMDVENNDCYAEAFFEEPPCCVDGECKIYELVVDPGECHDDGSYTLWIDFEYENAGNDFFEVFAGNNQYIGFFSLDDLPLLIDTFPGRDAMYDIITVCINDVPECCKTIEFLGPDCDGDEECEIYDLFAEAYECTDANTFMLDLGFEVENPGDLGFAVLVNGIVVDTFGYGEPYYTVGPLERMCDQLTEVKVIDFENECYDIYTFDYAVCCENTGLCEIGGIEVYDIECNDNGTYNLTVDFEYANNTNDFFDLWSGNTFVGYYAYEDLPIRIQNFPLRDAMYQFIKICDNDNPNCCAVAEFRGPDCDGSDYECLITDLEVLEAACTSTGDLVLLIDFHYESEEPNGIDVYVNDKHVHYEREGNTPLDFKVEGVDKQDSILITVCENDNPDCCDQIAYLFEEESGDCELLEMLVLQTECVDDFFYLVVDAEHTFAYEDKWFVLKGNGNSYGEYQLADLPVAIGPFHEEETINEMLMIMEGFEDCQDASEIEIECDCISNVVEVSNDQFTISETSTELRIESLNYSDFQIELYHLDGKKLMTANAYHQYVINKDNYAAGIYLMVIRIDGQEKSFKVFMGN